MLSIVAVTCYWYHVLKRWMLNVRLNCLLRKHLRVLVSMLTTVRVLRTLRVLVTEDPTVGHGVMDWSSSRTVMSVVL